MIIYLSLVAIIILSIVTGIITTIFEKKSISIQSNSSITKSMTNSTMQADFLASTLEVSSVTKQVDQIDLSNATSNQEYYPEPVIVAILDDDVIC